MIPIVILDIHKQRQQYEQTEFLRGATNYVDEYADWRIFVPTHVDDLFELAASEHVVGVFTSHRTEKECQRLQSMGKAVVIRNGRLDAQKYPTVRYDDRAIARLAAQHLLDCGFSQFAYCGTADAPSLDREEAFHQAITDAGFPCNIATGPDGKDRCDFHDIHVALQDWLLGLPKPCGLLAFNDMVANFIVEHCLNLEIRVPDELGVVGIDNNEMRCILSTKIPISSVDRDTPRLGYEYARLMDRLLKEDPPPPNPVRIKPARLVARASTDIVAFDDPVLARALAFIRRSSGEAIGVDDVAEHAGVNRRTLTRHFVRRLDRSPGDEIRRTRLDRARDLLLSTRTPLTDIAYQTGFSSPSYLTRAFKKAFGVPPSEYRELRR